MKKSLLFTIITLLFANLFSAQWSVGADIPEKIRAGNTETAIIGGKAYAYLFTGRNGQEIISDKSYRYNFSENIWETMANLPTPILGSSSAIVGNNIYIIGGVLTTPGNATKKVYKYSIPNNIWSQVADIPNAYTDGDAVAYQDSLIYTVGGYNSEKTFVYNVNTNKWKISASVPSPGNALSYGALSVSGNKLIYVGGSNGTFSPVYYNNVWIGEIDQNNRANVTWTAGTPFPGQTRTFFEMRRWENGVILIGGTTDNTFSTVSNENYFYDPQLNTWTALQSKPTSWNTGNAASVNIDGKWKLFCTGGFNEVYLDGTEIFTQENLSTSNENGIGCHLNNMKVISGKNPQLSFCTKEKEMITVKIFDEKGSLLKTIIQNPKVGNQSISLKNLNLTSGIFFAIVSQSGVNVSQKIQIVEQ